MFRSTGAEEYIYWLYNENEKHIENKTCQAFLAIEQKHIAVDASSVIFHDKMSFFYI